jgi:hypothetical protein
MKMVPHPCIRGGCHVIMMIEARRSQENDCIKDGSIEYGRKKSFWNN